MPRDAIGKRFQRLRAEFGLFAAAVRLARAGLRVAGERVALIYWRSALAAIGPHSRLQSGVRAMAPRRIRLGARCLIARNTRLTCELPGGELRLGDDVQVNQDCVLDFSGGLELRPGVLISEGAILYSHSHGHDPRSIPEPTPLVVEDGVWIGARALVLPGVGRIGAGSVVAAGSVLTKEAPPGVVLAGAPAKVIGSSQSPVARQLSEGERGIGPNGGSQKTAPGRESRP